VDDLLARVELVAAVTERAADPLARLHQRAGRPPDQRQPWQAEPDIGLDRDDEALNTEDTGGVRASEHAPTFSSAVHRRDRARSSTCSPRPAHLTCRLDIPSRRPASHMSLRTSGEQLAELHGDAHVALDLDLAHHEG